MVGFRVWGLGVELKGFMPGRSCCSGTALITNKSKAPCTFRVDTSALEGSPYRYFKAYVYPILEGP